jgi:hypothetical protein
MYLLNVFSRNLVLGNFTKSWLSPVLAKTGHEIFSLLEDMCALFSAWEMTGRGICRLSLLLWLPSEFPATLVPDSLPVQRWLTPNNFNINGSIYKGQIVMSVPEWLCCAYISWLVYVWIYFYSFHVSNIHIIFSVTSLLSISSMVLGLEQFIMLSLSPGL